MPATYTSERPAFTFTKVETGISIDDHYLARRIPQGTSEPSLFGDLADLNDLIYGHGTPTKLEDWIYTDKPALSLHVVTFTDATIVTLTWSHTLLDAMSRRLLQKAWTAVLEGREEDVPAFQGFDEDPIEKLDGRTPAEGHILYDSIMRGFGFFMFVFYMILETVWWPKQSNRVIFLPDSCVKEMRAQALLELRSNGEADDFVSDGDIIFAWLARTTVKALGTSPSIPVNLNNVMNMRGAVDDVLPPDQVYIGNATMNAQTFITAGELVEQPLSRTALRIRKSLVASRTPENIQAQIALVKQEQRISGRSPLFGPPNQLMLSLSNWSRAGFADQDFSAAVVKQGIPLDERAEKLGRPSFVGATGHENGFSVRNAGPCYGRDARGDWWLGWALRDEAWKVFEEEIGRMRKG